MYLESQRTVHLLRSMQFGNMSPKAICIFLMLCIKQVPIPYAPMIGALVGVTALIPYVGAWIATLVGAFLILTVNPFKALVFIIFLLTLQQIEGNAIYPK